MGPTRGSGTGSGVLCGVPRAARNSTPACCRSTTAAARPAGSGCRSARPRASEVKPPASLEQAVLKALGSVVDPELDRSLVALGFATAEVDAEGRVTVEVRLPTFWCAPNFAYVMAQDAREAVEAVPGVRSVSVRLLDHFSDEEVTQGVNGRRPFDEAFPVAQERVLRRLLSAGRSKAEITELRLADVDLGYSEGQEYLEKRRRLGLSVQPEEPLAVLPNGRRLTAHRLEDYLSRSRSTRMNIEANTVLCQGLHETRYGRLRAGNRMDTALEVIS